MRPDPTLSALCRAQHGFPHRPGGCTGCSCGCHGVRPPANFRAIVQRERDRKRAQTSGPGRRGEALPGLDPGDR